MTTHAIQLDEGLGVVIEQELLDALHITAETLLSVVVIDGRIVVTPIPESGTPVEPG